MKKIICLTLALLAVFTFSACSREKGEAPTGMKNASSEVCDFYLYVPKDWIVNTNKNDLMAAARVSDSDSSNVTMIGFSDAEKEYDSIDSFWDYYKGEFTDRIFDKVKDEESGKTKSSFKLTNKGEEILVAGKAAKKYEYTGIVAGSEFSYMQIIIKNDNVFYIFTYTSTPDLYSKHTSTIDTILKNVEFK